MMVLALSDRYSGERKPVLAYWMTLHLSPVPNSERTAFDTRGTLQSGCWEMISRARCSLASLDALVVNYSSPDPNRDSYTWGKLLASLASEDAMCGHISYSVMLVAYTHL